MTGPDTGWAHTTAFDDDRGHSRTERRTIRIDATSTTTTTPFAVYGI
ncbi:hypothetical protein ABZ897_26540 [Nonomuraea sp. NPDC046802]